MIGRKLIFFIMIFTNANAAINGIFFNLCYFDSKKKISLVR
jgi:hypothetical protein